MEPITTKLRVEITMTDNTTLTFTANASRGITPSLVKAMQTTGYLTLWNDADTLVVHAAHIKHLTMYEIGADEH